MVSGQNPKEDDLHVTEADLAYIAAASTPGSDDRHLLRRARRCYRAHLRSSSVGLCGNLNALRMLAETYLRLGHYGRACATFAAVAAARQRQYGQAGPRDHDAGDEDGSRISEQDCAEAIVNDGIEVSIQSKQLHE